MALTAGSWLNHYEILGHLGTGGMGEVYRARDNKLQREVALKVLPKAFAQDPERVARFRREAQVLAQLNHPNIAAIHSVEESGGTHFLVMELAEGETLRDRIKRGPFSIEEALDIAKQIAAGLEAAHEKPIVHRDLKPANVKVTPEGMVKILDFGLARAFAGDTGSGGNQGGADSPTLSAMTAPGTILGTAAYMSPEQARGKKVDKRTDIWALGCVLFEMLTGKQAFEGEDVAEILASVMKGEPDWRKLPENTPPGIRILLQRCMEKDVKRRFHAAADVSIGIEDALGAPVMAAVPTRVGWQRGMAWGLGALIAAVVVLVIWNPWPPNRSEPAPVRRYTFNLGPIEPIRPNGVRSDVALSPDGTRLVYTGRVDGIAQLFVRRIDQLDAEVIPGTNGADRPFFSPDGEWVAFFTPGSDRKLKKISVNGGQPQILCDIQGTGRGFWGPDDTIAFSDSETDQLFRVGAAGGRPEILTSPDRERGELEHAWPDILGDGDAILFTIRSVGYRTRSIAVLSLETGEYRTLIERGYNARYVPTGHLVFGLEGQMWAVPFDLNRLETTGPQTPILQGIQVDGRLGTLPVSFSDDGLLVYVRGEEDVASGPLRKLIWVDRQAREEPLSVKPGRYDRPQISPDSSRVAMSVTESGTSDIWIYDLNREQLSRLTFDPGADDLPLWSPDGLRVFFSSTRGGGAFNLFWKAADGTGQAQRLTTSPNDQYAHSCSLDGRTLAFCGPYPGTSMDLGLLAMGESREEQLLKAEFNEFAPAISPDGNWMAYISDETGTDEVFVRPFPNVAAGKWQISSGGARTQPVWGPDSDELFYFDDQAMMAVSIKTQPTLVAGNPRVLFPDNQYYFGAGYFTISPDGQRFLMMKVVEETERPSTEFVFVENWFEELKQRVPTGN